MLCDFRIEASTPLRSLSELTLTLVHLNCYCLPSLPLLSTLEECGQKAQVTSQILFSFNNLERRAMFLCYGHLTSKVLHKLLWYFFFSLVYIIVYFLPQCWMYFKCKCWFCFIKYFREWYLRKINGSMRLIGKTLVLMNYLIQP